MSTTIAQVSTWDLTFWIALVASATLMVIMFTALSLHERAERIEHERAAAEARECLRAFRDGSVDHWEDRA